MMIDFKPVFCMLKRKIVKRKWNSVFIFIFMCFYICAFLTIRTSYKVKFVFIPEMALPWCERLKMEYPLVMNYSYLFQNDSTPPVDYKPVYLFNFTPVYTSENMCMPLSYVNILTVVKSKVDNFELRKVIRHTWGKEAHRGRNRLVFLLGESENATIRRNVKDEFHKYLDIIQEDFLDNYYNNTFKTVMGIRWISKFCPQADNVFLVDDDVMVNFKNLKTFFRGVSKEDKKVLFSGNRKNYEGPNRGHEEKWFVSISVYPYICYPPYLSGAAILTSGHVIKMFTRAQPYVKYHKYDDVYISIIAQKVGIRPQQNDAINVVDREIQLLNYSIASHGFSDHKLYLRIFYRYLKHV